MVNNEFYGFYGVNYKMPVSGGAKLSVYEGRGGQYCF